MANLNVVFEDSNILIIDKPSGIDVTQQLNNQGKNLVDLANETLLKELTEPHIYPCHRLDRETSGLVIFAKGKDNQKIMMEQFQKREVKKTYLALVHGKVKQKQGEIKGQYKSKYDRVPQFMHSRYQVLEYFPSFTYVEVKPLTGRTHQIRVQFKSNGHPLVGESLYTFRKDYKLRFRRVALHASQISFNHPKTGKRLNFNSPLPEDMENFLEEQALKLV